jgi:hypothetical protein
MEMLQSKMNSTPPTIQSRIATAMNNKLVSYWDDLSKNSIVSAIIDPSHKLVTFKEIDLVEVKKIFEEKYKSYMTTTSPAIPVQESSNSSRKYFRQKLYNSRNNNTNNNVFELYLNSPEDDVDSLNWYKVRELDPKYHALVQMARDYLSVQVTSVPSEQAFSIAKNTITPTRNRLDPEKARASLCLKSWIDSGLINLTL